MTFDTLLVTRKGDVGIITMNRPEKMNAINNEHQNKQPSAQSARGPMEGAQGSVPHRPKAMLGHDEKARTPRNPCFWRNLIIQS